MKYVKISPSETLSQVTEKVGVQNVDQVLADNGLERNPRIGQQLARIVSDIQDTYETVSSSKKLSILNQFVTNSDIYEKAALSDEDEWKVLSVKNTFPGYLYISDQLQESIPTSYFVLGNGQSVPSSVYNSINATWLETQPLDANIFSYISTIRDVGLVSNSTNSSLSNSNPMAWFNIPTDTITLYSSLFGESMNIPAYPEELGDGRNANYTTMPDLIYQYEPWQVYESSGPRSNTYQFHLHRDMWSGNHNDGKANDLIRFCEAQVYPNYSGASVNTAIVTLYVAGQSLISGILTNVSVDWSGPIGDDGWYLEFTLSLDITEVSKDALSYNVVRNKPLIG